MVGFQGSASLRRFLLVRSGTTKLVFEGIFSSVRRETEFRKSRGKTHSLNSCFERKRVLFRYVSGKLCHQRMAFDTGMSVRFQTRCGEKDTKRWRREASQNFA